MLNRSKLWASVLLLSVFAAGGAIGGVASAAWDWSRDSEDTTHRDRSNREDRSRGGYAERLEAILSLTPTQRAEVDSILARQQRAMRELWEEVNPKFDNLRHEVRVQITEILDEVQRERYSELVAESDRRRERESGSQNRDN
jgi:hypothetical protein